MDDTDERLVALIDERRIFFDAPEEPLRRQLTEAADPAVRRLVVAICDTAPFPRVRISSIIRSGGHHARGLAVDIGNEEIARSILPWLATDERVADLSIDEIIFNATKIGGTDPNRYNYDQGRRHAFDAATIAKHRDHIHLAVKPASTDAASDERK